MFGLFEGKLPVIISSRFLSIGCYCARRYILVNIDSSTMTLQKSNGFFCRNDFYFTTERPFCPLFLNKFMIIK